MLRASLALLCLGLLPFALACGGPTTTERLGLGELETVEGFALERYDGTWYEIASFPTRFQEGCTGTTATYTPQEGGTIRVLNRCTLDSLDGKEITAEGVARPVDLDAGKLEVSFFGPFFSPYWVVEVGPVRADGHYSYGVVGHPSRDYLWILSRETTLDDAKLEGIIERLEEQGYETERLTYTLQPE